MYNHKNKKISLRLAWLSMYQNVTRDVNKKSLKYRLINKPSIKCFRMGKMGHFATNNFTPRRT